MTSGGRTGWRVLVVDDEENLNWSLVNSLRKEGYVTEGALTGLAAQQRLTVEAFDCVVSDVKMPGLDGFELLQWLRQHRPRTRVVMMTAFGSPTARQEALRGGVIAYLEKPFDLQTLKDELRRMTASAPQGNGQSNGQAGGQAESEGYDPLEVVRVLNLARRDMALGVRVGGQSGVLRFLRGELVWAEAGTLRGDEAFLRLCTPRTGQVQPEPWDGRSDRNVAQPLSRLIFMALSQREGRLGIGSLQPTPTGGPAAQLQYASGVPAPMTSASSGGSAATGDSSAPSNTPTPLPTGPMSLPPTQPFALSDEQQRLVQRLAEALPQPSGVLVLRQDGVLLGQAWVGRAQVSAGTYTHLATALQASARATLLADMGVLDELRITTTNSVLVLRRVTRAERGGLVVAVLPLDVDSAAAATILRAQSAELLDLFR